MRKSYLKINYLLIFFLLVLLANYFLNSVTSAQAQVVPIQIKSFDVTTLDGTSIKGPLMAGGTYKFTMTLEIAAGIKNQGILETKLERYGDRYWSLKGTYDGIDTTKWQPGQKTISFNAIQGVFTLDLQGTVPEAYVLEKLPNGDVLQMVKSLPVVRLSLNSGDFLEQKNQQVINKTIENYQAVLKSKTDLLEKNRANLKYTELVSSILDIAKKQAEKGYTDRATELLNTIPDTGWPASSGSTGKILFIAVIALALISLFLIFLVARSRSASAFIKHRIDEEARKLDLLLARVNRTGDTSLATEMGKVKKELEKICGR